MHARAIFLSPGTGLLRSGWRIPWLLLWVAPFFVAARWTVHFLRQHLDGNARAVASAAMGLVLILGLLAIYRAFARFVERREAFPEVTVDRRTLRNVALGFLFGGGAMLLITGILALTGSYRVAALNSPWLLLKAVFFYLPQSFIEDFLHCLVLYRLLKEGLGVRLALPLAAALFALGHMGNENESILGLLEILTGGFLWYSLYERLGSFWAVWAAHFSWNFMMNGVLGMSNSGLALQGFIVPKVTGPAWWTGGATGPEASIIAVVLDLVLIAVVWRHSAFRPAP